MGIPTISRSSQVATVLELLQVQLGRCRDVPHDHSRWVHRHHKVLRVFQGASLLSEDVNDLGETTGVDEPSITIIGWTSWFTSTNRPRLWFSDNFGPGRETTDGLKQGWATPTLEGRVQAGFCVLPGRNCGSPREAGTPGESIFYQ